MISCPCDFLAIGKTKANEVKSYKSYDITSLILFFPITIHRHSPTPSLRPPTYHHLPKGIQEMPGVAVIQIVRRGLSIGIPRLSFQISWCLVIGKNRANEVISYDSYDLTSLSLFFPMTRKSPWQEIMMDRNWKKQN